MRPGTLIGPALLGAYYLATGHAAGPHQEIVLGAGVIALAAGTAAMQSVVSQLGRKINPSRPRALVLGATREAARHSEVLRSHRKACEWVGFVSADNDGRLRCADHQGERHFENLEAVLDSHEVDEVIQVGRCDGVDSAQVPYACAVRGLTLRTLVRSPLGVAGRYTTRSVGNGEYVISFQTVPEAGVALVVKRALDIAGAMVGLLACAFVYLWLSRGIRRETEGSVLFTQTRVGRNGRRFKLFKFRTMHVTAEDQLGELLKQNQMSGHVFKMKDDPRVTPLGRAMRRRYLDELPQFWNVLKGEMSLVGTRPPTCAEVANYSAHHRRRLSMKPGMTGLWQMTGNGRVTDFEEIVRLDCKYIDNWSLWLDCRIIVKTVLKMLRGGGW
jgi:exopolysaccharide biosynthesis polyprenyl glycosylphosphotransferase